MVIPDADAGPRFMRQRRFGSITVESKKENGIDPISFLLSLLPEIPLREADEGLAVSGFMPTMMVKRISCVPLHTKL